MSEAPSLQRSSVHSGVFYRLSRFTGFVALGFAAASGVGPLAPLEAQTPVPVLTWRYDNTHAGQNTQETALTPANVNVNTFGKLFSLTVDSTVYAQPLYVPGLTMSDGKVHNVLFVATENDTLYAFDADSNGGANASPIWKVTLLDSAHGASAGATAIPWNQKDAIYGQGDIGPTIGITGTPVINAATNTMYVVGNTEENGQFFSRLHAINIITGAEQTSPAVQQSPVQITASVAGTGTGSSGGQVSFDPLVDNQRPALDFYNGYVYIGYAAHGDIGPWHGWLFAYNANTMQQTAALCLSPNGGGAGIWASGAGLPIDDDASGGRMFVVTGNNGPGDLTNYSSFSSSGQLGESIIDFSLANGGITPKDGFTSYNSEKLDDGDLDQGSGGILMVPDQAQSNPPILIQAGKEGRILVLNRNNLGGNNTGNSTNPTALQDITGEIGGMWSTPAYWNGNVYFWPSKDYPKLFTLTNGSLSGEPVSQSSVYSDFPGPSFSISSNGTQDGIAWAVRSDQYVSYGSAVMYAFDAHNLTTPIYETDTNSSRDGMGIATKFSIPLVTNGKVYAISHYQVDVYGLYNGEQTADAPVISPNGGTFTSSQSVTLTSTTPNAQIYYTLDGTTPTTGSTLYAGPITISTDTTVKAMTSAANYIQSPMSTAVFNFSNQTPAVTFSPAPGTYTSAQQVTLSDTDANAKIYYTLDGSTPSSSSTLYTGPIIVSVSEIINAVAIDPNMINSDIGMAAYVIQAGGETIDFGNGFSNTTGLTLNGSAIASNDSRMQLTDGGLNEAGSVFWTAPINIQAFTTTWTFQLSEAQANGYTFTIQNAGPNAVGGDSAGLGYQGIGKSVAVKFNFYNYENEGNDSTGFYTNGEAPLTPTIDISPSGIELNSDDAIQATLTYDGTTLTLSLYDGVVNKTFTTSQAINIPQVVGGNTAYVGFTGGSGGLSASQKIASWTYTTQAVPPAFTPPAGTYNGTQNVALTSATPDAVIYYTTNGTTPTAASSVYSGPIAVSTSETLEATAISPTMGSSVLETAAYTIQSPAFSLSASAPAAILQGASTTSTVTITPTNGFTGSVALACAVTSSTSGTTDTPTCTVSQPTAITGSTAVTATATIDTQAGTPAASYTATVTGTGGTIVQTASIPFTVNAVTVTVPSGFTVAGPAITIASPGMSGTSTVTITPAGGFTGTVALNCAITSSPAGAIDPPTCSTSQPSAISGATAVTSTLTINTTGSSSSALSKPFKGLFTFGGGGTVVALLLFGLPRRRRKWQALLSLLVLSVIAATAIGCGGSAPVVTNNGTTAGTYTVTVTGVSGSTSAKAAITVTVQ